MVIVSEEAVTATRQLRRTRETVWGVTALGECYTFGSKNFSHRFLGSAITAQSVEDLIPLSKDLKVPKLPSKLPRRAGPERPAKSRASMTMCIALLAVAVSFECASRSGVILPRKSMVALIISTKKIFGS